MTDLTPAEIAELKRLEAAADAGPWDSEFVATEGEFGTGEDTHSGYNEFIVYNAKGDAIFSTENAEGGIVETEYDEDRMNAWNENSRNNVEFCKAARNALPRLIEMVERKDAAIETFAAQAVRLTDIIADLRRQLAENVEAMQQAADTYAFELSTRNTTIDSLRRQLVERETEVERLKVSAKSSAEENEYLHNKLCEAHLDPSK